MDKIPFWRICLLTILVTVSLIIWTNTGEESKQVVAAEPERLIVLLAEVQRLQERADVLRGISNHYLAQLERIGIENQEVLTRIELISGRCDFSKQDKFGPNAPIELAELMERITAINRRMEPLIKQANDNTEQMRETKERLESVSAEIEMLKNHSR